MRIIIIQSIAFFDKNGDAGGGEIHLHRLASEWKKKGNEVILFTNTSDLGSKYYGDYDRIFSLRILDAKLKNGSMTLKIYLQWLLQFRQLRSIIEGLNKNTETLVIAGAPTISDIILFGLITRRLETTGVVYFHLIPPSPLWHPFKRGGIMATTIRWLNSQISLLFTKIFRAVPVMDHPLTLTESGWRFSYGILNDDDFLDVNPADYEDKDVNTLCFIARNDISKGVMDLPEIIALLNGLVPQIKLTIAGSIPNPSILLKLESKIRKRGLQECITIRGYINQYEKEGLLKKSSIFAFPSYEDSWSLSVMEAAAYSCVPVTYDLPAYDYLGQFAVKVSVGNTEEMARVIYNLICDQERRILISKNLKDAVSKYNAKDIAIYQLDYFNSLLNSQRNDHCRKDD
jgi:glycosyltransferase involved in cell wall biosynthesis